MKGSEVKDLMRKLDLSAPELAEALGVTYGTVMQWVKKGTTKGVNVMAMQWLEAEMTILPRHVHEALGGDGAHVGGYIESLPPRNEAEVLVELMGDKLSILSYELSEHVGEVIRESRGAARVASAQDACLVYLARHKGAIITELKKRLTWDA